MSDPVQEPGPTADAWIGGASGAWTDSSNWSLGYAPGGGDNATIDSGEAVTVAFGSGSFGVDDLIVRNATFEATAGAPATLSMNGGASDFAGLTLTGVTLEANGTQSGDVTSDEDIYSASWTIAAGDLHGQAGAEFVVSGGRASGLFQRTAGAGTSRVGMNFRLQGGTISSATGGTLEFDSAVDLLQSNFAGVTLAGGGTIVYGAASVVSFNHVVHGDRIVVTDATDQTNSGAVKQYQTMTLSDGSTILNAAGGLWEFIGGASILSSSGAGTGNLFSNRGEMLLFSGITQVDVSVASSGTIALPTGELILSGATNSVSGTVTGAGELVFQGGGAFTLAYGAKILVKTWSFNGGVLSLGENLTYAGAFSAGGGGGFDATLALNGKNLTLTGTADLGLAITGKGALNVAAATIRDLRVGGTARVVVSGAATQIADDIVTIGDASPTDAAQLAIGAGGSWTLTGGDQIALGADAASTITTATDASHPGALVKSGAGVAAVAPTIYNYAAGAGGIEAQSGALDVMGKVYGTGASTVSGSATLEFDNLVAAGQSVAFAGSHATLNLTDLGDFSAKISGFEVGSDDAMLIGGGWSFAGAAESASAATLAFTLGASRKTLTLLGDYRGDAFSALEANGELKITA